MKDWKEIFYQVGNGHGVRRWLFDAEGNKKGSRYIRLSDLSLLIQRAQEEEADRWLALLEENGIEIKIKFDKK